MRPTRAVSRHLDDGLRLGTVLRQRREALGRSREAVARQAHVSTVTLTKIERGDTVDPGLFTVRSVAGALEWSVDDVLSTAAASPLPVTPLRFTAEHGLLSIGYEGRTVDELVHELTARQVAVLVDVRLTPISRKPGLSKTALASALTRAGIRYEHLPALGNPRANRAGFANPNDEEPRARFRQLLDTPAAADAARHLTTIAEHALIAVMCFERDERTCHRHLVLDHIRDRSPQAVIQRA